MAHELTQRSNGFVEMAFVGETPWHKLGQELEEGASIEQWQVAAGMDWSIERSPVRFNAQGNDQIYSGQSVLYRSDDNTPLSVVSNRYKPVQPKEVLGFFRDLVAENGFKIHTAGTLMGGKRMWALAETGKFGEVCKGDGIGGFLLLSTSCDKTLATTARFTTVRVVCNNTLTAAVNRDVNQVSFSHIQQFDHVAVKAQLGNAVESFGSFMEMAKHLQKAKLSAEEAKDFVSFLVATSVQLADEEYDVTTNRAYKKILALFNEEAKGIELVGHTKWGMVNAVTVCNNTLTAAVNRDVNQVSFSHIQQFLSLIHI